MKKRMSNYELMRLVLMFMVLFWHVIVNIVFYHDLTETEKLFWNGLHFLLEVHIDVFVILTGYFQCNKEKIGILKAVKLNNQTYFYKIIFLFIFILFFSYKCSHLELFRMIQPITLYNQYWYIAIYLLLYLVSPFINKLLKQLNKNEFRKMIITLFFISSILPIFTNQLVFNNNSGFSLLNFILMYTIGAYFQKYPIQKSYIFCKLSPSARKLFFFATYIFLGFLNTLIYYFGERILSANNEILVEIGVIIKNMKIAYDNPILIIEACSFFLLFGEINIKCKWIDFISKKALDVYLIHDNPILRSIIYKKIQNIVGPHHLGGKFFIISLLICIAIYISCIIIGELRCQLFKLINWIPLVKSKKESIKNKIDSLEMGIVW